MDFIYTAEHALPDALCDEAIARFEGHPGAGAGITTMGMAAGKKSSVDLTIDNFKDLQDLHQRILDTPEFNAGTVDTKFIERAFYPPKSG